MYEEDRDNAIAQVIRNMLKRVDADMKGLNYPIGSPEYAFLKGKIVGMEKVLAYFDPNPQQR